VQITILHSVTSALLSSRQAAELLGKSVSSISRAVTAGRLTPALRLEGQTGAMWFRRDDVEALLEATA